MSQARTDKVKLSFNAGQYSPFLDSRVDIDKAAAATREQRNMLSEVGGTARRRPGLRYVLETNPGIGNEEQGNPSVNYVEFPFFQFLHWRADPGQGSLAFGISYRGIVRVWESGTVQMVGEAKFAKTVGTNPSASLSTISYKVWFGQTGQPGSLQTVVTIPTTDSTTWYPVDWSGRPGALEHCETYYGGIPVSSTADHAHVELWQYPDGLVVPPDPPHVWGGSAGGQGITACGVTRDGNDIDFAWGITGAPFTTQHYINTWEIDSATLDAAQGFALVSGPTSPRTHLNASTLYGSLGGTGTSPVPDSATIGLRVMIWTASINVNTGTFDCGPFFRLAYAPAIQSGVDPEA